MAGQRVADGFEEVGALHVTVVVDVNVQHQSRLSRELQKALQRQLLLLRTVVRAVQDSQVNAVSGESSWSPGVSAMEESE